MDIGFIGLGNMGFPMARRLIEAGHKLTVYDTQGQMVSRLTALGAVAAASPRAVAEASDIVILCVLHTDAVRDCVFGDHGIAAAHGAGKFLVDHSTIDPAATREMAQQLQAQSGMRWVDAPVSGGPVQSRSGTLTVMAGGESADIDAVRDVMADLAANFTHIGPVGAGQTAKMINQLIVGSGYVVLAEALTLAEAAGVDAQQLPQCLAGGHADSSLLKHLYPQMHARDFDPPRSYARQLLKDLKAVSAFAHELDLSLPMLEAATRRYTDYVEQGNGMKDTASIVDSYRLAA